MRKKITILFLVIATGAAVFSAWSLQKQKSIKASSAGMSYRVETLVTGLGVPWGMAFLSSEEIIFTLRQGAVGVLNIGSGNIQWLEGVAPVEALRQGGLLDVVVRPGYKRGDWIYFTYSKKLSGGAATTLARAKRSGSQLISWEDLLVTKSVTDKNKHFGSRVAFDDSGNLYFTVGDRGRRPNGQDLSTHAGSVLRVTLDGKVPDDNPFVGKAGALPEIWSYGHRNPQGIAFDNEQNRLWIIEHGPRGGDEINLVEPGNNYGWPVISYGREYSTNEPVGEGVSKPGMEQPVKVYIPSIAPGSLVYYQGDAFPAWRGNLIAGALRMMHLNRVVIDEAGKATSEERLLESLEERIRALVVDSNGWLYFSTDNGRIMRIVPN